MKGGIGLVFFVFMISIYIQISRQLSPSDMSWMVRDANLAIKILLGRNGDAKCTPLIVMDPTSPLTTLTKYMGEMREPWGMGVFVLDVNRNDDTNMTQTQLSMAITRARRLRQTSWCVTVVLISDNTEFLDTFAQLSLKGRFLVWSTRLLVVTVLPRDDIRILLTSHWTYSMNNVMALNIQLINGFTRCGVFVHLPYTAEGAMVVQVASWTPINGFKYFSSLQFFPEKYQNFHGMTINVTSLPYEPYWLESMQDDNVTQYSGMDYSQLVTLSQALNFTFRVLPSNNWAEVTDQVEARESFIATCVYIVLPNRRERWDYTNPLDITPMSFGMAKPVLKPSWLSYYYPLTQDVWLAIIISTIIVCFTLVKITGSEMWRSRHGHVNSGAVVMEAVGSLFGQGLYGRLSTSKSNHMLVGTWLLFGVVISTAYRGSLIASLNSPRLPPRAETVEQLVQAVDRATYESYGTYYKESLAKSDSKVLQALERMLELGLTTVEGLSDSLVMKTTHLNLRLYLELIVAQHFVNIDGTTPIYIGKETILPASVGWPVPHDAPYTHVLDNGILMIRTAGLYDQWERETLAEVRRQSRARKREELKQDKQENNMESNQLSGHITSVTLVHMQGPLLVLLLGLVLGALVLAGELLMSKACVTLSIDKPPSN